MFAVSKGLAIGLIVKLAIGIIVIAVALSIFGNGLPGISIPTKCNDKTGIALSSVEALKCGIDMAATQSLSVASCTGKSDSQSQDIMSKFVFRSASEQTGGCKRTDTGASQIYAKFACTNKNSCVPKDVECKRTSINDKWSCRVLEFELPQSQTFRDMLKAIGLNNVAEANEFISEWIGAVGQPDFVLSYEYFPSESRVLFTRENKEISSVMASVALGGLLNLAPGGGSKISATKNGLKNIPKNIIALFKKDTYVGLKGKLFENFASKAGVKALEELTAARLVSTYATAEGIEEIVGKNVVKQILKKENVKKFTNDVKKLILEKMPDGAEKNHLEITLDNRFDYFWSGVFEKYIKTCRDIPSTCTPDDDFVVKEMMDFVKISDLGIPNSVADDVAKQVPSIASAKTATDDIKIISGEFSKSGNLLDSALKPELAAQLKQNLDDLAMQSLLDKSMAQSAKKYKNVQQFQEVLSKMDQKAERISEIAYKDLLTKLHTADKHSGLSLKGQFIGRLEKSLKLLDEGTLEGLEDKSTKDAAKSLVKKALTEKAPMLLKGLTGLPADLEPKETSERLILMAAVYILSYNSIVDDTNEALHKTCGGNTLCLMTNKLLLSGEENYWESYELKKDSDVFVSSKVSSINLDGEEFERAYALSPCKANVDISLSKDQKCNGALKTSENIYYEIRDFWCYVYYPNDANKYSTDDYSFCLDETKRFAETCLDQSQGLLKLVTNSCAGQKDKKGPIESFEEDESKNNLVDGKVFSISFADCKKKYNTDDIFKCVNDDSLDKIDDVKKQLKSDWSANQYNLILKQTNFRAVPINIQKDVNGNLVTVSDCSSPYFAQEIVGGVKSVDTVTLRFNDILKFKEKGTDPNYCVLSKSKMSDWGKLGCQVGTVAGSLATTFFTTGATSQVTLYMIGSSGVVCDQILDNTESRWPNTQQ